MRTPGVKLGLFLPPALHGRMTESCGRHGVGAAYARAFVVLLDQLDAGEPITFAAVRGTKSCVTVRLPPALAARVRGRARSLNLKITDFACTAVERALAPSPGT